MRIAVADLPQLLNDATLAKDNAFVKMLKAVGTAEYRNRKRDFEELSALVSILEQEVYGDER